MQWWGKLAGVYEIRNLVNGKVYIGSTNCLHRRIAEHRRSLVCGRHYSTHLQGAWNKYGADAFVFQPILICSKDRTLLCEQAAIDGAKSSDPRYGYNGRDTASAPTGVPMSEAVKAKISASNKGKVFSESHRKAIGDASRGRIFTEESREKVSAANKGRRPTPEQIRKAADFHRGRKRSAETCARISAARKGTPSPKRGVPVSEKEAQRLRTVNTGRILSPEHKAKIAAGLRRAYEGGSRPKLRPGMKAGV